jgi:hypothetical protein
MNKPIRPTRDQVGIMLARCGDRLREVIDEVIYAEVQATVYRNDYTEDELERIKKVAAHVSEATVQAYSAARLMTGFDMTLRYRGEEKAR